MVPPQDSYWRSTRTATYGFVSAIPLLLLYEVIIVSANRVTGSTVRVGAEIWIRQLLSLLGTAGAFGLGIAVCAAGIFVFIRDRENRPTLRARYFGYLIAESGIYAVAIGVLIAVVVGNLLMSSLALPGSAHELHKSGLAVVPQELGVLTRIGLSIGAGLYEELVFRVLLVGGLFWLATLLPVHRNTAYVLAAVVGALLFSWVHYLGPLGDVFAISSFLFRFLFGLALNAVFLVRGFGVAAWTHALYDVFVVTGIFRLV